MTTVSTEQEQALAGAQGDGSAVQPCAVIVVIDPGHGDRLEAGNPIDPGAVSGKVYEKDIALDVSNKLKPKLEAKTDCIQAVYLTRDGDISEVRKRLAWRVAIAKEKKANIFISLHLDASDNASAKGQSVLYHPNSANSKSLAVAVSARANVVKPRSSGGPKPRDNLYVIKMAHFGPDTKAAVLVELGFISNESDRNACLTQADAIAQEIADGIADFILANKAIFSGAGSTPQNVPLPRPRPTDRDLPQNVPIPRPRPANL
ncbi:N-acetylmuramoyl-L-alanine amidase family protein [Polyangium spumosum]|uniref:N-acetylmuramoyl-L-alanine amidase n=1 Tax=Polyangium spumosum TaxID=889282 RepID=A0A6N7PXM2_9BACT|nr:N-acetylmuramoyl-L-alanine amidase [Polyangium spumosum]MRG96733.1 hypothetical protein [Polyangium spumosum]